MIVTLMAVGFTAGCSSSSGSGGSTEGASSDSSSSSSSGSSSGSTPDGSALTLDTPDAIDAYLDGKTMVMTGADIPPDLVGVNENTGQCWNKIAVQISSSDVWSVTFVPGTLSGTCDHSSVSGSPVTVMDSYAITNVQGNAACFDLSSRSMGTALNNSGRGSISPDGKMLSAELYVKGQATGDTCADGPVGSHTVILNGTPFTGNAVQVYRIQ